MVVHSHLKSRLDSQGDSDEICSIHMQDWNEAAGRPISQTNFLLRRNLPQSPPSINLKVNFVLPPDAYYGNIIMKIYGIYNWMLLKCRRP